MTEEAILKRWSAGPLDCTLWQDGAAGLIKGGIRDGQDSVATIALVERYGREAAERMLNKLASELGKPIGEWDITDVPITDIVLVPYPAQLDPDAAERPTKQIFLAKDIVVFPVDNELRELIYRACDPPGVNAEDVINLRPRPLFAIARIGAPRAPLYTWDSDERLQMCIALSRIVHPTSISLRYAVRIIGSLESGPFEVWPGPVSGFGAGAWTAEPERDCFSSEHFGRLQNLLSVYDRQPIEAKSRLGRAFWYFQYAVQTHLVDLRWTLVVTALETLLGTSGDRSTQSFIHRVPRLADRLDRPQVSEKDARRMWGLRSGMVHGQNFGTLKAEDLVLYRRMEELLREALIEGYSNPEFSSVFESPASIDVAFPLPSAPPKTVSCPVCSNVLTV